MTKINSNHSTAKIVFRVIFAILAVAVMVYIFLLSNENAEQSSKTSSGLIEKIADTFVPSYKTMTVVEKNEFVSSLQDIVRKLAHISIFGALGVCVAGFSATFRGSFWLKLLFCQLFSSAYAFSDEYHQKFSGGRSFQYTDIAYDSVGAFAGIVAVLLISLIFWRKSKPKMKKKDLVKHVEALTEKLLEADECIKELNDTVADKESEISLLNQKIENITASASALPQCNEQTDIISEQQAQAAAESAVDLQECANAAEYSDFDLGETEAEETEDIETYAVKVIGKIITESVKVGCVLASANTENKKELLNLALGRTEVAKNEISALLASDLSAPLIKASIDKEAAAVADYYQSILAQI